MEYQEHVEILKEINPKKLELTEEKQKLLTPENVEKWDSKELETTEERKTLFKPENADMLEKESAQQQFFKGFILFISLLCLFILISTSILNRTRRDLVIVISIDGFRSEYLTRGLTPTLLYFGNCSI
jgi:hypothetical protein